MHCLQPPGSAIYVFVAISLMHSEIYYKKKTLKISLEGLTKLAATYFPTWYSSIIGTNGLNFSVRYGKRWIPIVITTIIFLLSSIYSIYAPYSILMREKHFGYRLLDLLTASQLALRD